MSSTSLNDLTNAVSLMQSVEMEIDDLQQRIEEKQKTLRNISEELIPGMFQELGLKSLKTESGQEVTVAQEIYSQPIAANQPLIYKWLEKNNFGGLIKTEVSIPFSRSERGKALAFSKTLNEKGYENSLKESVHPQTMKAFLKEQLREGNDIPLELFGAKPVFTTKIKNPKKK
jgi:hypothetical protein